MTGYRSVKRQEFLITDDRLDGLGLVDYIQHIAPMLPVIVVSANDLRQEIREKDVVFFGKPYDFEGLSLKIASMFGITLPRLKS